MEEHHMIDSDAAGPGLDVDDVAPGQRPGAHAGRKGELGVHEVCSVEQRPEPSAGRDGPRRGLRQQQRQETTCATRSEGMDVEIDTETMCCTLERGGLRLSPWLLVCIFIYCNLLNYVDRGLVNGMLPHYCVDCLSRTDAESCGETTSCNWLANTTGNATCGFNASVTPRLGIGGSFRIKETSQGIIAGSFMVGYCISSPIFAYLCTVYNPFTLMGLGLSAWCLACVLATIAPTFGALVAARVVSGIGEASFQCIAPCFIDDSAPAAFKGKVLAAFFMAVPIGQAIGYAYGGFMCSSLDPEALGFAGWRAAFFVEGLAMLPVAALCFLVTNGLKSQDAEHEAASPAAAVAAAPRSEGEDLEELSGCCARGVGKEVAAASARVGSLIWEVTSNGVWVCTTLGYAGYTFSIGGLAVWAPSYLQRRFSMPLERADLLFGAVAVGTGLVGTLSGGLLLDSAVRVLKMETMEASMLLSVILMSIALPICFLSFCVSDASSFFALLALGQLFAFATTTPVNGVLLWCVPKHLRTLSMALSVLGIHLLGDVPSPVIVGAMLERMEDKPAYVMQLVSSIIAVAIFFWAFGFFLARRSAEAERQVDVHFSGNAQTQADFHVPLLTAGSDIDEVANS